MRAGHRQCEQRNLSSCSVRVTFSGVCVIVCLRCPAPSSACSHDSSRVARLDGEVVAPLDSDGDGVVDRVGDGAVRGEGEVILTGEAELVDELLNSSADASSGLASEGYEVGALSVCNLLILVLLAHSPAEQLRGYRGMASWSHQYTHQLLPDSVMAWSPAAAVARVQLHSRSVELRTRTEPPTGPSGANAARQCRGLRLS